MKNLYILLFLISSFCTAQNLNFTIDTAVDNGTSITETITVGPDTFVLTVFHSGNEELDNLGGGDLVFFHSSIDPLTPHILTVTKNGSPVNFDLNSMDYDTLEAGTISLTNQDDDFISSPTFYALGAGTMTITNPANALNISEVKINPTDTDDLNDFGFHNVNITINETLSVDQMSSLDDHIDVFPNPSDGKVTIKNSGVILEMAIVTDVNGRTISSYNLEGTTIDKELDLRSVLSTGIYFMTISSESASTVKKIIIE